MVELYETMSSHMGFLDLSFRVSGFWRFCFVGFSKKLLGFLLVGPNCAHAVLRHGLARVLEARQRRPLPQVRPNVIYQHCRWHAILAQIWQMRYKRQKTEVTRVTFLRHWRFFATQTRPNRCRTLVQKRTFRKYTCNTTKHVHNIINERRKLRVNITNYNVFQI